VNSEHLQRHKTGPDSCSDVGSHTQVSVKVDPKVMNDGKLTQKETQLRDDTECIHARKS